MSCSDYCIVLFKYIIATLEKHRRALRHLNHYVPQKDWMVMKEQSLDVATARPSWLWLYNYDIALQSIMKYNRTWFTLLSLSLSIWYTQYTTLMSIPDYCLNWNMYIYMYTNHRFARLVCPHVWMFALGSCVGTGAWILRQGQRRVRFFTAGHSAPKGWDAKRMCSLFLL